MDLPQLEASNDSDQITKSYDDYDCQKMKCQVHHQGATNALYTTVPYCQSNCLMWVGTYKCILIYLSFFHMRLSSSKGSLSLLISKLIL